MTQQTTAVATRVPAGNLPAVKTQDELQRALARFQPEQFNVMIPPAMNFSGMHKVAFELVYINTAVDAKHNGSEIYSVDGGKTYTFHAKAANKIAAAAGISWTHSEAVSPAEYDSQGQVLRLTHSVGWSIKRPNGMLRTGVSTGFYNYKQDLTRFGDAQAKSRRNFAGQLAEANAKYRAIFDALDQLPRQLTMDEMKKPFIVPCVTEDWMDLIKGDPETKRMVVAHAMGIKENIFGPTAPVLQIQRREEPEETQATVVTDKTTQTNGDRQKPPVPPLVDTGTGEMRFSEQEYKKSWLTSTREERIAEIGKLIKYKNYTPKPNSVGPDQLPDAVQIDYLWFLFSLPDPKPAETVLPW